MEELEAGQANPELKALVTEALRALAALDAARLEELAATCEALIRKLGPEYVERDWRRELARQAQEAESGMAVFARVLEATRANLNVMKRLKEMRRGELEYEARGGAPISTGSIWAGSPAENGDGNH